ncbi:2-oxo-tetronate isomerase [Xanthobacter sp. VNH20]|uniref:2-oxo-tetronate isomerase n=1 Tax=Xanthobacter sp. VNH20 TaxID=3156616 RepID=UPI0032B343DC
MPKFAANLHYMFNEVPFLDRFEAAAQAGFTGVEFQVPYGFPKEVLAERLAQNKLSMVLMDTTPGDWDAGERGIAALPGREEEFRRKLDTTIAYCRALGCDTAHAIAGVVPPGISREAAEATFVENLRYTADRFAPHGISAVIEPINGGRDLIIGGETYTTYGMRGFFLNHTRDAVRIIEKVGRDNLRLHLDVYHMQLTDGNLAETLQRTMALIQHIQIAGVPGRNEPDRGEINYPYLFDLIDRLGYAGWIGCEYKPLTTTLDGLGWAAPYGVRPSAPAPTPLVPRT